MIPNMAPVVFHDEIEALKKLNTREKIEERLANYLGQPKSETEDDADEVIVVENPDEL